MSDQILELIRGRRSAVHAYLVSARPKTRRLLNITIIGGTIAAALTGAPAVGGQPFTTWMTQTLGLTSPSWRLLCAAASVASIAATVATQMLKSNNLEQNVAKAEACRARLEVLELGLTVGQLDPKQATSEYLRCVEDAPFLSGP